MKNFLRSSLILASVWAASAFAATKSYQVTGPVLEVNDKVIVVQKGSEKWSLIKGTSTKAPADLKVGDKVTAYYEMTATEVEKKEAKK